MESKEDGRDREEGREDQTFIENVKGGKHRGEQAGENSR